MSRVFIRSMVWTVLLFSVTSAQAALIDRGGGLIYDDVLDITWTQNYSLSGLDTWSNQVAWADGLVYGGASDWRIASMDVNGDGTLVDCATATEADCRDNEYGYLYHYYGISQTSPGIFTTDGPALGLFWSSSEWSTDPANFALIHNLINGGQGPAFKNATLYLAWAVHDGDIAAQVPVPAAAWLFSGGLAWLGWLGKRSRLR